MGKKAMDCFFTILKTNQYKANPGKWLLGLLIWTYTDQSATAFKKCNAGLNNWLNAVAVIVRCAGKEAIICFWCPSMSDYESLVTVRTLGYIMVIKHRDRANTIELIPSRSQSVLNYITKFTYCLLK
jgi:hypothetical protein